MARTTRARPERVVVIGGSQGAIEALLEIVPRLPSDFPASIFVVVHQSAEADSYLARILSRGALPAVQARDGSKVIAGRIYVAPPDHHLTVESGTMRVRRGPFENRHRPAIDPLFRTAARAFGPAVIAVILSGNLDDGSAGLLAVRRRGGIAIVQDPPNSLIAEMPERAIHYAGADYVLPPGGIAGKLIELVSTGDGMRKRRKSSIKARSGNSKAKSGNREVRENEQTMYSDEGNGKPSVFACPECHGVLWEIKDGKIARYRCRVGHAYSADSLKGELDQSAERAMWAAMRALEEKAAMTRRMMESTRGPKRFVERLKDQADADTQNAEVIRRMIFSNE